MLGLGLTGYLLPWDMKAYFATVVTLQIAESVPIIGDFTKALLAGGEIVGAATLTRFLLSMSSSCQQHCLVCLGRILS